MASRVQFGTVWIWTAIDWFDGDQEMAPNQSVLKAKIEDLSVW
jgi:hypothetical protein